MSAAEDRLHALAGTLRLDDTTAVLEVLRLLDEERAEATRLRAALIKMHKDRDSWRSSCNGPACPDPHVHTHQTGGRALINAGLLDEMRAEHYRLLAVVGDLVRERTKERHR